MLQNPYIVTRTQLLKLYLCPHCGQPYGADLACPCLLEVALHRLPGWLLRGLVRVIKVWRRL